jgi:TolB-like protein/Flp pilus assembly protein TadD
VTEPSHTVFLSYASQDAEAACKLGEVLRAAGVEVFLDQNALQGGDAWDQKIRRQILDCALFIPMISQNTQQRLEGYFRHEWNLAIERTHHMAREKPFLVPIVLDGTKDQQALVPDAFRAVQWTRLSGGDTPPAFVDRIKRLLSTDLQPLRDVSDGTPGLLQSHRRSLTPRRSLLALAVVVAALICVIAANSLISSKPPPLAAAAFAPPQYSIAVLPFVNLSGDKEQEYFSDGLTEELLNSLSEINELQVAARTSAFFFKGKDTDIATIARKLNVSTVLEGSVRRSDHTLRVTAQLINAVTGFHMWSKTYDRDLGDVLNLQTDIATAVAGALKLTLLGDVSARIELGGTHNAAAFDAYLRGAKAYSAIHEAKDLPTAIAGYTEAVRLDPHYAMAFAARSIALSDYAALVETGTQARDDFEKAHTDARRALDLAPNLAEAHLASGLVSEQDLDFAQASEAYDRALALAPGNAVVLEYSGTLAVLLGHADAGLVHLRHAVVLDPLARGTHYSLAQSLYYARRYEEAIAAFADVVSLEPEYKGTYGRRGFAYYGLEDLQRARDSCETKPDYWVSRQCLAVIYEKLGRHADAQSTLEKLMASEGDTAAYQYATIYAQWGNRPKALEWLETALRLRDTGLAVLKADPLFDPLRKDPRFERVEKQLKFSNR